MTYRDEFDEPPRGGSFLSSVGPKAAFFIVLIALSFMIGVVWKLYVGANDGDNAQNVPIVRADGTLFKVTPEDPGGMEIPHKDSTIFSSLKSDRDGDKKIENLLAKDDNEELLPRSQLFAGLNTEKNPDLDRSNDNSPLDEPVDNSIEPTEEEEEMIEEMVGEGTDSVMPPPPQPEEETPVKVEEVVVPKAQPKPEPKPEPVKIVQPKPEPVKTAPPPASTSASSSGDYYVQLASVKTADGAEGEWKKLTQKYSSQLVGYSHRVEKADLGDKGIFYRIQAGPVSKDKATQTCNAIKQVTPGGCLVKRK